MKKIVYPIGLFLALALFSGCSGIDGNAYQKYWWPGNLQYIYDTNPATPSIVCNDEYFPTEPGQYYMEYVSWDGYGWYLYYTISVNEGEFMESPGDDSWFEIFLFSYGPSLYEWNSSRAAGVATSDKNGSIQRSPTKTSNLSLGERLGSEQKTNSLGTIRLEWGRLSEDEDD